MQAAHRTGSSRQLASPTGNTEKPGCEYAQIQRDKKSDGRSLLRNHCPVRDDSAHFLKATRLGMVDGELQHVSELKSPFQTTANTRKTSINRRNPIVRDKFGKDSQEDSTGCSGLKFAKVLLAASPAYLSQAQSAPGTRAGHPPGPPPPLYARPAAAGPHEHLPGGEGAGDTARRPRARCE